MLAAGLSFILLPIGLTTAVVAAAPDATEQARAEIWANELGIYNGRSKGMFDFYIDHASEKYLGWPPTSPVPFPISTLRAGKAQLAGKTQEKIETIFKGFTMTGTTAIIYYTNHRTQTSVGAPVDQYFENIHVWTKESGTWKVLGGLARMTKG